MCLTNDLCTLQHAITGFFVGGGGLFNFFMGTKTKPLFRKG